MGEGDEMNKKLLRHQMKEKLQQMDETSFKEACQTIIKNLLNSEEWAMAQTVGITISTGREIDTKPIIEEGWKQQKRIVVPKCYPNKKEIKFYQISSFAEVEDSFYSLKEPIIAITPFVPKEEIDLVIVPGIIFDNEGYRIGYGGGYYDRYLHSFLNKTVALAFPFQIVASIPKEEHDIPVGKIISST